MWCGGIFVVGEFVPADGVIKLMEVNPNPAWDYGAKLAFMAGVAGMSCAEMLRLLVDTALVRVDSTAS